MYSFRAADIVTLSPTQMNGLRFKGFVTHHPADFSMVRMQSGLFLMWPVGSISLRCFGVTVCKRSRCIRANAELLSSRFSSGVLRLRLMKKPSRRSICLCWCSFPV